MDILKIPFVEKVGITQNTHNQLELIFNSSLYNHLNTIHASAQFALAETATGEFLQLKFPHLVGKVIPVLRESHVKFKKPATKTISAHVTLSTESIEKFNFQFNKKGRALLTLGVDVIDIDNVITCSGTFTWFIQGIE